MKLFLLTTLQYLLYGTSEGAAEGAPEGAAERHPNLVVLAIFENRNLPRKSFCKKFFSPQICTTKKILQKIFRGRFRFSKMPKPPKWNRHQVASSVAHCTIKYMLQKRPIGQNFFLCV